VKPSSGEGCSHFHLSISTVKLGTFTLRGREVKLEASFRVRSISTVKLGTFTLRGREVKLEASFRVR